MSEPRSAAVLQELPFKQGSSCDNNPPPSLPILSAQPSQAIEKDALAAVKGENVTSAIQSNSTSSTLSAPREVVTVFEKAKRSASKCINTMPAQVPRSCSQSQPVAVRLVMSVS
jgi:hypothetical protein